MINVEAAWIDYSQFYEPYPKLSEFESLYNEAEKGIEVMKRRGFLVTDTNEAPCVTLSDDGVLIAETGIHGALFLTNNFSCEFTHLKELYIANLMAYMDEKNPSKEPIRVYFEPESEKIKLILENMVKEEEIQIRQVSSLVTTS
jgi:hypothetical protein